MNATHDAHEDIRLQQALRQAFDEDLGDDASRLVRRDEGLEPLGKREHCQQTKRLEDHHHVEQQRPDREPPP